MTVEKTNSAGEPLVKIEHPAEGVARIVLNRANTAVGITFSGGAGNTISGLNFPLWLGSQVYPCRFDSHANGTCTGCRFDDVGGLVVLRPACAAHAGGSALRADRADGEVRAAHRAAAAALAGLSLDARAGGFTVVSEGAAIPHADEGRSRHADSEDFRKPMKKNTMKYLKR